MNVENTRKLAGKAHAIYVGTKKQITYLQKSVRTWKLEVVKKTQKLESKKGEINSLPPQTSSSHSPPPFV